ncbi:MAG: DUF3516 domain-containing protein, partial [Verrucomicrobiales bacterium]|nr:DUF3516 domain-containing protein [Verrucomicrobiales bacterium]
WDETTFRTLIESPPEKLSSSFTVNHGVLLNLLSRRDEDGCAALRKLIDDCHETVAAKRKLRKRAFSLFRGLVEGRVLSVIPWNERRSPAKVELNIELQDDFSLNQALGLYLLEAIPKLDREDPEYALQVLSLVESILEDPVAVIRRQVDKAKAALMAEMKSDGVEYEERIERLDEVEHPKPGKEFIYATYNEFVLRNPWAKEASVRPKSVAREMFENWQSFEDYIKSYGLERSEAVLLRHLSEVYKVLAQTVPPALKSPEVEEASTFFETMLRGVDSSLLDEWERMRRGEVGPIEREIIEQKPQAVTRDKAAFTRLVRTVIFDFLKLLARGEIEAALEGIPGGEGISVGVLGSLMADFSVDHGRLRFDPEARNAKHCRIEAEPGAKVWKIEQIFVDEAELNDWSARFEVALSASAEEARAVISLTGVGPIVEE